MDFAHKLPAHMKSAPTHPSIRDSQRFARWLLALLNWLAIALGVLGVHERYVRQRFAVLSPQYIMTIERIIVRFVIVRAAELTLLRATKPRAHDFHLHTAPANYRRILSGGRLRRAMKARDLRTRIVRLAAVLANVELWARRMVRRLKRNLTRLHVRKFEIFAQGPSPRALAVAFPDSS
jgi:hypothetical protein